MEDIRQSLLMIRNVCLTHKRNGINRCTYCPLGNDDGVCGLGAVPEMWKIKDAPIIRLLEERDDWY